MNAGILIVGSKKEHIRIQECTYTCFDPVSQTNWPTEACSSIRAARSNSTARMLSVAVLNNIDGKRSKFNIVTKPLLISPNPEGLVGRGTRGVGGGRSATVAACDRGQD